MRLLLLAAGGSAGTLCRYAAAQAWGRGSGFPWATLAVNLLGSFALGALLGLVESDRLGRTAAVALGAGFLGAFTTFSTFSVESVELARAGRGGLAAVYVGASVVGGLVMAGLGLLVVLAGLREG